MSFQPSSFPHPPFLHRKRPSHPIMPKHPRATEAAVGTALAGSVAVMTQIGGALPLELLRDQESVLLTTSGWQPGRVVCIGSAPAVALTLVPVQASRTSRALRTPPPGRLRTELLAAADARWFSPDGGLIVDLPVGDDLRRAVAPDTGGPLGAMASAEQAGYRAGLLFGDGCRTSTSASSATSTYRLRLCGPKAALLPLFELPPYRITTPISAGGDPVISVRSALSLKHLPPPGASVAYVAGFIHGWLRADATPDGTAFVLATQNAAAAMWLGSHAVLAGLVVLSDAISPVTTTPFGLRAAPLHRLRLTRARRVAGNRNRRAAGSTSGVRGRAQSTGRGDRGPGSRRRRGRSERTELIELVGESDHGTGATTTPTHRPRFSASEV